MRPWLCFLIAAAGAFAQSAGVVNEWDAQKALPAFSQQVKRVLPILEQLRPEEWVQKGASAAYIDQWKNVRKEVGYLDQVIAQLAEKPDRLPVALDALFRLESVETKLASLSDAIRRYQNPALADLVQSMIAENNSTRLGLRQYVQEVAAQRETEWRVMEAEAQRCRANLMSRPKPQKK